MNKYETYQTKQPASLSTSTWVSDRGYPVYTRDRAIVLAEVLPGTTSPQFRLRWLLSLSADHMVESTPIGLIALDPRYYASRYRQVT